jgi:hypothetical protein
VAAPPGIDQSILERGENVRCEIGKLLECCRVYAFGQQDLASRHVDGTLEIIFQLSRSQLEASAGVIWGLPGMASNGLVQQTVTRWRTDRNDPPLFVHQVDLMDTSKQVLGANAPSSHRSERMGSVEDTMLYFLILRRTFELFPRFVDWEAALTNFCLPVSPNCGALDGLEAVKCLRAGNGNDCSDVTGERELADRFHALRVRLMSQIVRLRFIEQEAL